MNHEERLRIIEEQYAEQEAIFAALEQALASIADVEIQIANEKLEEIERLAHPAPTWQLVRPF